MKINVQGLFPMGSKADAKPTAKQPKSTQDAFSQLVDKMTKSTRSIDKAVMESQKPVTKDGVKLSKEDIVQLEKEMEKVAVVALGVPTQQWALPEQMQIELPQHLVEMISAAQAEGGEAVQQLLASLQQSNQLPEGLVEQILPQLQASGMVQMPVAQPVEKQQPLLQNMGSSNIAVDDENQENTEFSTLLQEVKLESSTQDNSHVEEFALSRSFRDAVAMVKQNQQKEEPAQEDAVDIDALQMQADSRRTQMEGQVKMQKVQPSKAEQALDVASQITEKMQLHLQKGEREFTMKLNPDSLGEITVKLLQKDGKMTLSIAAANETTVKLLNGQLEALKMAVRPMQVEVKQAVVQTQEPDGQNMQQQMDMGSGQFFDQSQQAGQQQLFEQHKDRSHGLQFSLDPNAYVVEEASPEQAKQAAQIIADNLLDMYL